MSGDGAASAAPEVPEPGSAEQVEASLLDRSGLPAWAAWLRDEFAAAPWTEHRNFGRLAAFWQQVHGERRAQGAELRALLDGFREEGHEPDRLRRVFAGSLGRYLSHLDMHHRVEDGYYFPRFRLLDHRLVAGFDLLENDHQVIHRQLEEVAQSGNRLIQTMILPAADGRADLDRHADAAERLVKLLDRHLDDEEDLVIPAILRHGEGAVS